ncbi:hypothetical protein [Flavobacterium humi]|uniref:Uncharacterized protein n=1 Tax=Flavobacterium humi TaxID=2562683 RepID=A0A4Z0LDF3_9FLAO|nr:hypothetical protein [Flavobacterium humi]TGD59883.1 hypothetical protein E4635_02835 [Flavobacterium humi]
MEEKKQPETTGKEETKAVPPTPRKVAAPRKTPVRKPAVKKAVTAPAASKIENKAKDEKAAVLNNEEKTSNEGPIKEAAVVGEVIPTNAADANKKDSDKKRKMKDKAKEKEKKKKKKAQEKEKEKKKKAKKKKREKAKKEKAKKKLKEKEAKMKAKKKNKKKK